MGWIIGTLLLLAVVAVGLGLARDASLGKKVGREIRDRDERRDPQRPEH